MTARPRRTFRRGLAAALATAGVTAALSEARAGQAGAGRTVVDPLGRPALMRRAPERAVLLDVTQVPGGRLVAVGERGIILMSDDQGRAWTQVAAPTSVTLTGVHFPTANAGWAVGHAGVVLHSNDGGLSWRVQLDGRIAAALALDHAHKAATADPRAVAALRAAGRLVADGPDKPFLTLHFFDEREGFVAGAFGLLFRTTDGGATWTPCMDRIDNPDGQHVHAMRSDGRSLFLAGEQGLLFASRDRGASFERLEIPYEGTFFSLAMADRGRLAVGGLRGNLFLSDDGGRSWRRSEGLPDASVNALVWQPGGALLLANQSGRVFVVEDGTAAARPLAGPPSAPVAGVAPDGGGGVLTVGLGGIGRIAGAALSDAGGGAR